MRKNQIIIWRNKFIIAAACLLVFAYSSNAQVDSTVYYSDSLERITDQEPEEEPEESTITTVEESGNSNEYFIEDWQYESDSSAFTQRRLPADRWKKLQEEEDFWYSNAEAQKKKSTPIEQNNGQSGSSGTNTEKEEQRETTYVPFVERSWFQIFIWILVVLSFLAALGIYLANNGVSLFRKKDAVIKNDEESGEIPEDIFAINYQKEIDKAAASGNYRLAIRLMFLRLLKKMAERNIIKYQQDKTNFDYLMQLQSTAYYSNFSRITRNYEYSWYGKFPVSEEGYQLIRKDFDKMDRQF